MKTAIAVAVGLLSSSALAHFKLVSPASWSVQNDGFPTYSGPQKSPPCGQADPGEPAVPTDAGTMVAAGSMLTITILETITHPGHYRVQLAPTMNQIPANPAVTAGSTACGSTVIDPNPSYPLLADGKLVHTGNLNGQQSFQVPIPAGMTCTNCVLQVAEFMSNHGLNNPGGCFYHHCAIISVYVPDGGSPDAGGTGGGAGGSGGSGGGGAGGSGGGTAAGGGAGGGSGTGGGAAAGGGSGGGAATGGGSATGGNGGSGAGGGAGPTGGCSCDATSGAIGMVAFALAALLRRRRN